MTNHKPSELSYLPQPALDRITKMCVFDTNCAGHQLLEQIANKWTILIIYALTQGKKRYTDLKGQIQGISAKMLIQNLRNLERCGLIKRDIYPTVPPRVEYYLTSLGESLVEPLAILGEWSYKHIKDVKDSMTEFDRVDDHENYWQPK
jgi:DNA-binding HxlR family transcriptional regulator